MSQLTHIAELRYQEKLLTDYLKSPEAMELEVISIVRLGKEILRLRSEISLYERIRIAKTLSEVLATIK